MIGGQAETTNHRGCVNSRANIHVDSGAYSDMDFKPDDQLHESTSQLLGYCVSGFLASSAAAPIVSWGLHI